MRWLAPLTVVYLMPKSSTTRANTVPFAQQRPVKHLTFQCHKQAPTSCLLRLDSNGALLSLVVDGLGIKYTTVEGANHLIATLKLHLDIKIDWNGATYIGFIVRYDVPA